MTKKPIKTPPEPPTLEELEERGQTKLIDTAEKPAGKPQKGGKPSPKAKPKTTPKKPAGKPQDAPEQKPATEPTPEPQKTQKTESAPAAVSSDPQERNTSNGAAPDSTPKLGQPRKYNEPLKHIGFKIPISADNKLRLLADLRGLSTTQYILKIIDDDYNENKEVIDKILTLKNGVTK